MNYEAHGKHLIAGKWVESEEKFSSSPASGNPQEFSTGNAQLVDDACKAAEAAFWEFGYSSRKERAKFLNTIADEIEARGEIITAIGTSESGLPAGRLEGERGRTTGQLRFFADHILKGDYLDKRIDEALPDRAPMPRPEIKLGQRPVGPVAVFGASNFPLAFSVAGGDTAAALAAGCPVVVKAHSAHPGTSEIVAEAIHVAIEKCGIHAGVFSMVHGGSREVGTSLVQHPLINAVGFTGSLGGGRALFDLCAQRPTPIPFFGELGSVNPVFLLPQALSARGVEIANGWAGSLTMGAGQFCTNPGIIVAVEGKDADIFVETAVSALNESASQVMLTDGIAQAYRDGRTTIASGKGVQEVLTTSCDLRNATPYLFTVSADDWLANEELGEEVFGPLGVIIRAKDEAQMLEIANALKGQLTCTLQMDAGDIALGQKLMPVLERKAGRILANGFPTGVEVCDTMVHGGPYPASTNFGATSVGSMSIRRFLRPVSYQNLPKELLPEDFQA